MTVADLIAELQKLPPYLPVAVGLDAPNYEMCDVEDEPFTTNLTPDLDCLGLTEVRNEGRAVRLIGAGMYWGSL